MVFQIVGGRQLWRRKGVDREYLLYKIREFHRVHKTPLTQCIEDIQEAFEWLPKSSYNSEAKPLTELTRKRRRGIASIGKLLIPLLIRLGVVGEEDIDKTTDTVQPETRDLSGSQLESDTSEARNSA